MERRSWRSVARWLLRHPFHVATLVTLVVTLAHRAHAFPWQADAGDTLLIVVALYGVAVVAWKWAEEERRFRAERRQRAGG